MLRRLRVLSLILVLPRPDDAAKADMAHRGVDRLCVAGCRAIPPAVIRRAEMRAALQYLARDRDFRLSGIKARLAYAAARVLRDAAGFERVGLVPRGVPVVGPFPDIADHVDEAVAVRREGADRRGTLVPVACQVFERKHPLPSIRHGLAAGGELIPPGVLRRVQPAPRREFPFGLGWQLLAGPCRIGLGVAIGDVYGRRVMSPARRAARAVGAAPVGAQLELPPPAPIAQIDGFSGRCEDKRAGADHVRQGARVIRWVGFLLG